MLGGEAQRVGRLASDVGWGGAAQFGVLFDLADLGFDFSQGRHAVIGAVLAFFRQRPLVDGFGAAVVDLEAVTGNEDLRVPSTPFGLQLQAQLAAFGGRGPKPPVAPARSGSEPWMLEASTRLLVNSTRALMPGTGGASRASWTALASGFGGGFGPSPPIAIAAAVTPIAAVTARAQMAINRRVEIRLRADTEASFGEAERDPG